MSSSDIDRFYTKVTKDFIANLGNNKKIVGKMEENNIDLNEIEEVLFC